MLVICDYHGAVPQKISNHIHNKSGCIKCAQLNNTDYARTWNNVNANLELYLYHMQLEDKNGLIFHKIGLSVDPNHRLNQFCNLKSKKILETKFGKLIDLYPLEQKFHQILKEYNVIYEPPELINNGSTECYIW